MSISLDENENIKIVNIISKEGKSIDCDVSILKQSNLLKTILEHDVMVREIPLDVKYDILVDVTEYMKYHHSNPYVEIEKPIKSVKMSEIVSDYDAKFIDLDKEYIFELLKVANYMDIKSLLDLCCAKVASMIKGKSLEEIKKEFN